MKKNKLSRLAILLLVLVIVAIMLVAGTYAKYTSEVSAYDTATVAKWSIKVGKGENPVEIAGSDPTITFNLFDTIVDSDGNAEGNVAGVASGLAKSNALATDKIIAPGTSGSFELKVKNASQVDAKFTIALSQENTNNVPLQFKVGETGTWKSTITDAKIENEPLAMEEDKTITVYWKWEYEVNAAGDTTDTNLGILAQGTAPTVKVTATITATQVD